MESVFPTGTITLIFTDIEGSSELWEQHRAHFRPVLDTHNHLIREFIGRWDGYEVKTQGDSFMIAFSHARNAVQCALDIQQAFARHSWPVGEVLVRIGMYTGEPFVQPDPSGRPDYFGPVVNRAARVTSAAHGGQILISSATYDAVHDVLTNNARIVDSGYHRLRGFEEPEHLFEIYPADLPARQFPPLRTLLAEHIHLPNFSTPFLGRSDEIEHLRALLLNNATRLLIVLGPGGIGKTRLSVRVAEEVAERLPDGVRFVELESARTQQEMFTHLKQHLDIVQQSNKTEEQSVLEFLATKKLLLVLDNAEQIVELPNAIDRLLSAAPGVKFLLASRERLQMSGAHIFEVASLPVPPGAREAGALSLDTLLNFEGVQFFVARSRQHSHNFQLTNDNATDIAELCRQLEGVPLALELAAAWIGDLSPAEILEEMEHQLDLLSVESIDIPERQRAMRSSIDWSFMRLEPNEQRILVLLSTFAGGFTRDAVSAVCRLNRLNTITLLRRFNSKSLLTHSEVRQQTRFTMLYTIRRYLREQLAQQSEAEETQERHARYFLNFVQERMSKLRTPEEITALQEIADDLDNLRAALEWCIAAAQYQLAAEIALELGQFLERRGFQEEALHYIETGLQAIRQLPQHDNLQKKLHGCLLRERASSHLDQEEWEHARHCALAALEIFKECSDLAGIASAYNLLGLAACRAKLFDEATNYFRAAGAAFEQAGARAGQAIVWHNLGLTASESHDMLQAAEYLQQALRLRREQGDQRGLAETLNNLGVVAQEQGKLEEAWTYYSDSLQCERELQHAFGAGRALFNLGEIAELKGDLQSAYQLFAAAEQLFSEVGSPYRQYAEESWRHVAADLGYTDMQLEEVRRTLKSKDLCSLSEWALTTEFL